MVSLTAAVLHRHGASGPSSWHGCGSGYWVCSGFTFIRSSAPEEPQGSLFGGHCGYLTGGSVQHEGQPQVHVLATSTSSQHVMESHTLYPVEARVRFACDPQGGYDAVTMHESPTLGLSNMRAASQAYQVRESLKKVKTELRWTWRCSDEEAGILQSRFAPVPPHQHLGHHLRPTVPESQEECQSRTISHSSASTSCHL